MNERIKLLLAQAGVGDNWNTADWYSMSPEMVEKFAELIVAECVEICNQAILQNQDTLSKLSIDELAEKMVIHGSINQAQKLGNGINEHFGVEE